MQSQDKKVNLLMAVHCHQPVGNFPGIFQDAYEKAYQPFLDTFEKFSNIKLSLHYSGSLIDWLVQKHPEFIDRLKALVKDRRIELIGGGYFEPILALIPFKDALGQIAMFKERMKEILGCEFKGVWLTERVWEPKVPYLLNEAGVDFTIVDDYHFKITCRDAEKLNGYYLSEEESKNVLIFPGSEKLRYMLPFRLPDETINYLRERLNSQATDLTVTFADDGEKFGLWPGTNKWVYRDGWLKNFFSSLEANKDWINTRTFSEQIKLSRPTDRIYLPCASYREMLEWSGGFFRNFFVKYPEANNMHKKMCMVSRRLEDLEKKQIITKDKLNSIKKYLYMSQSNDAYWHGIFGGLYLSHLRSSVYENLIKAENLIEELEKSKDKVVNDDFDRDGKKEIFISSKRMRLCLRPEEGATISEWDDKSKCFNLTNTITRRFEQYHLQLKEKLRQFSEVREEGSQPLSIHNQQNIKDIDLDKFLLYDKYTRYSLRDYLLDAKTNLQDFYRGNFGEVAGLANAPYELAEKAEGSKKILTLSRKEIIDLSLVKITKVVKIADSVIYIDYLLENFGIKKIDFIFGADFNLSLYDPQLSGAAAEKNSCSKLTINDLWKQIRLEYSVDPVARVWSFPIETVSDSDSGIEKMYQGLCVFLNWPVTLAQNGKFNMNIELKLS